MKPNQRNKAVEKAQKAVNAHREPVGMQYKDGVAVVYRSDKVPDDPIKQVRQYQLTRFNGSLAKAVEIEVAIKKFQADGNLVAFKAEINRIFNCKFW